MSNKKSNCFKNPYQTYSSLTNIDILNETKNGPSEKFLGKLQKFKASVFKNLNTNLRSDIFHDGTVYTGSAGLAMYYFMCDLHEPNHDSLKTASQYLDIDHLKGRKISFLCGDAGPLALATVISFKLGSRRPDTLPDYKALAQRLIALGSLVSDSPDEILYGRSGYLYALLWVNTHITGKEVIPALHIEKVANSIIRSGKQFSTQTSSSSPLLWEWHDKLYLGAAHGMAGILYILLQARNYINVTDMRCLVKPTLDWLLETQFPSGNFPSSYGSASGDRLVQWCHGAPGFVPVCLLAFQVFKDNKYLNIAKECAEVVWKRGLSTKGYSLCHGVAGNAYSFIQLYQVTEDPDYLYRACCFMEWCALQQPDTEMHEPDRPASLFEGVVGRLYLAEDISHIKDARFPALQL